MLMASDPGDQNLREVGQNIIQGKLEEKRNPIERFNQGIEFLNAMHYHANWEARPLGPRIELRHCPYRDLAQAYPILCDLDHNLLQDIFGRQLTVIQLRTRHDEPLTSCIFQAE
jgi:predicted ArsR family transcriptional regulator